MVSDSYYALNFIIKLNHAGSNKIKKNLVRS